MNKINVKKDIKTYKYFSKKLEKIITVRRHKRTYYMKGEGNHWSRIDPIKYGIVGIEEAKKLNWLKDEFSSEPSLIKVAKSKSGEYLLVSFPYNPTIVKEIKKCESRKWQPNSKNWAVLKTPENEKIIEELQDRYRGVKLKTAMFMKVYKNPDSLRKDPGFPTVWNHLKKEYAAIINIHENGDIERNFLGTRTDYSSSRKNASIEYHSKETPENLSIGTVIEVKDGSYKNMYCRYFRKVDDSNWVFLGTREGTSDFFTGRYDDWIDFYQKYVYPWFQTNK